MWIQNNVQEKDKKMYPLLLKSEVGANCRVMQGLIETTSGRKRKKFELIKKI